MLTKIYDFIQEEMLGCRRKLMLEQMSIIIRGKQTKKILKGIVSSINIFISIWYGLKVLKGFFYAFLEL